MSCNCPDCRPARRCRTPHCDGAPVPGCSFCRDCEDERADHAYDEAKDRRLEEASPCA